MMHAEIITTFSEFQQCKRLYEVILSQIEEGRDNVFNLYKWHEIWLKTYKDPAKPLIITIYDGDTPIALFPLCIRTNRKWGILHQYIEYVGAQTCNYANFLVVRDANRDEVFRVFLQALRGFLKPKWIYMNLPPLPTKSPGSVATFRDSAEALSFTSEVSFSTTAPFIRIKGDWEWYLKSYISKKLRHNLNNQINRVQREIGEITLESASSEELEQFFEMHIEEWGSRGMGSRYLEEGNREFDKTLLADFEYADFTKLKFGDYTVAYHLGYKYNGHFYYNRPTFDIQFSRFSPGKLFLGKLIEREIEQGTEIFDLGRGQQEYKYWFGKDELPLVALLFYRNKTVYTALRVARCLVRGVRKWK